MKTFNANFTMKKNARAASPVLLAVFHFAAGDQTVSDRDITPGAGAPFFKGLVSSWGRLVNKSGGLFSIGLPEITIEIANASDTPFAGCLEGAPGETEAELFLWFEGLAYSEKEPLGRFVISSPVTYTEETVRLTLVNRLVRNNIAIGKKISREDYPGADPDSIGKVENTVYGAVKDVPCHAVTAGASSALVSDITDTQTAGIELSMGANETPFPQPGTLQIGSEKISYTGISGKTLNGVARGASGSSAAAHKKGAVAFEVRGDFTYLAAGHPVKAIGDVYVDGVRVTSGVTRQTDGGGKAKVILDSKFVLEKSVSLSVSEGSHAHGSETWSGQGTRTTTTRWTASANPNWTANEHVGRAFRDSAGYYFFITGNGANYVDVMSIEYRTMASGTYGGMIVRTQFQNVFQDSFVAQFNAPSIGSAASLCDGNFNSFCTVIVTDGYMDTRRSFAVPDSGIIVGAKICSMRGNSAYSGTGKSSIQGGIFSGQYSQGGGTTTQYYKSNLQRTTAGAVSWNDFAGMTLRATYVSGTSAAACFEHWVEVYYVPYGVNASPATGVSLSGDSAADFVVGGRVTCDMEGYADDPQGAFTGTPGALITNPADVMRHVLVNNMGLQAQEVDASFDTARAQLAGAGYALAGVVEDTADAIDLLEELSAQSRVRLTYDGYKARLKFLVNNPALDRTLTADSVKKSGLSVSRAGRDEIINRLDIHYARDYTKRAGTAEGYTALAGSSAAYPSGGDPASVAAYGEMYPRKPFCFGFVNAAAMASDLRDFYITRFKDRKRRVALTLFLDNIDLEEGDVLALDFPSPSFSLAGARFFIEGLSFIPGGRARGRMDEVEVKAVEVTGNG